MPDEHEAFRRSIMESPHDPTGYRVYSDYLQDHDSNPQHIADLRMIADILDDGRKHYGDPAHHFRHDGREDFFDHTDVTTGPLSGAKREFLTAEGIRDLGPDHHKAMGVPYIDTQHLRHYHLYGQSVSVHPDGTMLHYNDMHEPVFSVARDEADNLADFHFDYPDAMTDDDEQFLRDHHRDGENVINELRHGGDD